MRVLYCNKYNFRFSGTEVYLFDLMDLMRRNGNEVALFAMADEGGEPTAYDKHFVPHMEFKGKMSWQQKIHGAAHAIYSTEARRKIRDMIEDFRPDVAHIRGIYHHLSPSVLWELRRKNIPVLYHLNDFKLLCPNYNLVCRGSVCEACKGGGFWNTMRRSCYPGIASRATLMTEAYVHRWLGTYGKCVDLFLAPSKFVRDKFVEHGWESDQFDVLPHFQSIHPMRTPPMNGPVLYFGRLSREKGVEDLLRAMQQLPSLKLVIAGDGPQRSDLQKLAASLGLANVSFVGHVGPEECDRLIDAARFTVFPSHAYETFGKTIVESYALGRTVIASDLGSRRELIRDGETGLLYKAGRVEQLAAAIHLLATKPEMSERMGRAGWESVRQDYTPDVHYQKLMALYDRLLTQKRVPSRTRISAAAETPAADSNKLRVAFIGGRGVISKYSGIESYYEEVGKRLAAKGHEVSVYCRTYFTPDLPEHNGMRLVRLGTIRSKHLETVTHTLLSTAHALTQNYDLVHYHALGPALFSFVPRVLGMRTAVTVQGLDWQRKKWGRVASAVLRLGEKASVKSPNGTMVVSRALQERYMTQHSAKTFYTPNGGVLRERKEPRKILEWGLQPGAYVLFLGRFSPEKGCHLLVDAFEQLQTEVKLVMAGGSSYTDAYSRELRAHASERIRMLDWVSGDVLDELLTNAMIFVLPSDLEGLSLALLDAMGSGLCVLVSDVPENREVVDGAGFTFQRGNAADLADRLRFLIANPAVREAAGRNARKRIEDHYQWQKIADDIESAYMNILGRPVAIAPAPEKKPSATVVITEEKALRQRAG
ncbi:MAG TPA: glycosyltransferase family 4 protein [Dongiaceae bacterium]|nr:glycosyltransferase family 4 protein [Dongiaceae bacterium]